LEEVPVLTKTRILSGVWEGVLTMPTPDRQPDIEVSHAGQPMRSVDLTEVKETPGQWVLRIAIPPDLLSDGVQTFVVSDRPSGARLSAFTIVTGVPLEDDIRAEVDLLRSELDMLKRAFRRHCLETM